MSHRRQATLLGIAAICCTVAAAPAAAQTPAEFFRGKTVHLVVGAAAGAAYDFAGRALAAHYGRFIPGNPGVVVENMPGAAGLPMMNHLYNRAARDGSVIGLPLSGIVLEPRLKALSREGGAVLFDLSKMSWIGTPAQQPQSFVVWKDAPFYSLGDLQQKEALFGTTSVGTDSYVMPLLTNYLMGTKIKVIAGYKGVTDVFHAIEQGELQGAAMRDPAMIAEAKKFGIEVDPLGGGEIEALLREIEAAPEPLIEKLRKIIEP